MKVNNLKRSRPSGDEAIKILQIGEGRLLRGLIEPIIEEIREDGWEGIVAMTNIRETGKGNIIGLRNQGSRYNIVLRDDTDALAIEVTCTVPLLIDDEWADVLRISSSPDLAAIITNSTEKGYVLDQSNFNDAGVPKSFIGILTMVLYKRFKTGTITEILILPTELIPRNGNVLKEYVLKQAGIWNLESKFIAWVNATVHFRNTIVDRIVTELKDDEVTAFLLGIEGYSDHFTCLGEKYGKWWIEGSDMDFQRFPIYKANEVCMVEDLEPYQRMKLWILNAAHLYMACAGLSVGLKTVSEVTDDSEIMSVVSSYWEDVRRYVGLPADMVDEFITKTLSRFRQKWLNHKLTSIATNIPEKWRIRIGSFLNVYYNNEGVYSQWAVKMTEAIAKYLSNSGNISIKDAVLSLTSNSKLLELCLLDLESPRGH
ncbi:MAG: hypothetical protein QW292_14325 [Candidatus Parvarchaeota archaeon]